MVAILPLIKEIFLNLDKVLTKFSYCTGFFEHIKWMVVLRDRRNSGYA